MPEHEDTPEPGSPYVPPELDWHFETKPWHYGYEDGDEHIGEALAGIRRELGFDTTEEFSAWIYTKTDADRMLGGTDLPPVLLDAFEFPALGWTEMMYVIEGVAEALGVSPGTMLDEIRLRASGYNVNGEKVEE